MLRLVHPLPLTASQVRVRLFLRAAGMSLLQSTGVVLLANLSVAAAFTSGLIAWHWFGSVRDVTDYRIPGARFAYACGGGVGALVPVLLARLAG